MTEDFIREHRDADVYALALQRGRYPEVDIDFALRQIEGYQRAKEKLPTLAETEGWWFPARLNIEQCSSEVTARYKASLVEGDSLVDLTGGYGIDSYYLSEKFRHTDYVEQQSELCGVAEHNFRLTARAIAVHNTDGLDYLQTMMPVDCIYIDPARRGKKGEKVVRLEECQPDVASVYPLLRERCRVLLLKLSPMLDLEMALRALPATEEVHIVEVNGEVKELLVLCRFDRHNPLSIRAVQLTGTVSRTFCFTLDEEKESVCVCAEIAVPLSPFLGNILCYSIRLSLRCSCRLFFCSIGLCSIMPSGGVNGSCFGRTCLLSVRVMSFMVGGIGVSLSLLRSLPSVPT